MLQLISKRFFYDLNKPPGILKPLRLYALLNLLKKMYTGT